MADTKLVVNPTTGKLDVVQNIWKRTGTLLAPVNSGDTLSVPGSGSFSEQFGKSASASGSLSLAVGKSAIANQASSMALGNNAQATGAAYSMAIGQGVNTSHGGAIGIGFNADSSNANELTLGDANLAAITSIRWGGTGSAYDMKFERTGANQLTITASDKVIFSNDVTINNSLGVGIAASGTAGELDIGDTTTPLTRLTFTDNTSTAQHLFYENATLLGAFLQIGQNFVTASRRGYLDFQSYRGGIAMWTDSAGSPVKGFDLSSAGLAWFPRADTLATGLYIGSSAQAVLHRSAINQLTITASDKVIFSNDISILGVVDLVATTSGEGQITQAGDRVFHTYGTNSLFIGRNAGNFTFTGAGANIGIGYVALDALTTGTANVAIGVAAGSAITTGNGNFAFGTNTLGLCWSGSYNVGIGEGALYGCATDSSNIAIGRSASYFQRGSYNVSIGYQAGNGVSTHTKTGNVLIGTEAGYTLHDSDNYCVMIGYHAGRLETAANKLYIANTNTSFPLIGGDFSTADLDIHGDLNIGTSSVSPDTTLARTAANQLTITASDSVIISNDLIVNGSIGLGIDPPVSPLHIYENTTSVGATAGMTIEQDGTGDAVLQFLLTGVQRWVMGIDNSDNDSFIFSPTADLSSGGVLWLGTSGQVGIGKSATDRLHVYRSGANVGVRIEVDTNYDPSFDFYEGSTRVASFKVDTSADDMFFINDSASNFGDIKFRVKSTLDVLVLTGTRRVAIGGLLAPTQTLEVIDTGTFGFSDIAFSHSAANQLTITASDKVITSNDLSVTGQLGVGTISPTFKAEIVGTNNIFHLNTSTTTDHNNPHFRIGEISGSMRGFSVYYDFSAQLAYLTSIKPGVAFTGLALLGSTISLRSGGGSAIERMQILAGGNVQLADATSLVWTTDSGIERSAVNQLTITASDKVIFSNDISVLGVVDLVTTTSTDGQITQAGSRVFHTFGNNNTFIGKNAGNFTLNTGDALLGVSNTAIGENALDALTDGYQNIAIGLNAATSMTTGFMNFALGDYAMQLSTVINSSVAIGRSALIRNEGTANVGIGRNVCGALVTGQDNTVVGAFAHDVATSSSFNTIIGAHSAGGALTGSYNIFVGGYSGHLATSNQNTFVGYASGYANVGASGVFLGYSAGRYETAGAKLFIDNAPRSNEADGRVKALIYGVFASTTASQELHINANLYTSDVEKHYFRDSAIGIYSQADTFLDLFADGAVRIGDSSAGAPTTYMSVDSSGGVIYTGEGSGNVFAELSVSGNLTETTITTSGEANKVQFTLFDTNGLSNNMTPDHTNDHITVDNAGKYLAVVTIHADSVGGAGAKFGFSLFKNNGATEFSNVHAHRDFSGGGTETGSVALSGLIDLAANDTIELWVWNETNTQNIVLQDVTFSLVEAGGT